MFPHHLVQDLRSSIVSHRHIFLIRCGLLLNDRVGIFHFGVPSTTQWLVQRRGLECDLSFKEL